MAILEIYIPYLAKAANGDELKYALRSIDKYVKFKYIVTIVGDKPKWCTTVRHVSWKRNVRGPFPSVFDTLNKLRAFINQKSCVDNYVIWYDDTYVLKDIDEHVFDKTYALYPLVKEPRNKQYQSGRVWASANAVKAKLPGKKVYSFETHMPRMFSKQMMREIFATYNMVDERLLPATVYYNHFLSEKPGIITKRGEIKAGFYRNSSDHGFTVSDNINRACENKIFLNNAPHCWAKVEAYLKDIFTTKSRFEK